MVYLKSKKLHIITISTMLMIICIIALAKTGKERVEARIVSDEPEVLMTFKNNGISTEENRLLSLLPKSDGAFGTIYFKQLYEHLGKADFTLGTKNAKLAEEQLIKLDEIILLEGDNDPGKMSVAGKESSLQILREIYRLCGLDLEPNFDGEILWIKDLEGNILYKDRTSESKESFRVNALLFILSILIILFLYLLKIDRKNNTNIREVTKYGHDNKKYA